MSQIISFINNKELTQFENVSLVKSESFGSLSDSTPNKKSRTKTVIDTDSSNQFDFQELSSKEFNIAIIPIQLLIESKLQNWIKISFQKNPEFKLILTTSEGDPIDHLVNLLNEITIFKIISEENPTEIHSSIVLALEESRATQQKIQMKNLILERNRTLTDLQKELEDHIEKRQKFLIDSRSKLFETNQKQKIVGESLLAILKATSLREIEKNLALILSEKLDVAWIRIIFNLQDISIMQKNATLNQLQTFTYTMFDKNKEIGSIVFLKNNSKNFSKEDKSTLTKICAAVQTSLDRINKLELTQDLKQQWEVTFNAITQPLILVDSEYEIIQFNKSFSEISYNNTGRKCYEKFFNLSKPCSKCTLGSPFSLQTDKSKLYSVHSSPVNLKPTHIHPVYVNYYQDITEDKMLENQIIEKSKKAEIGTISSSIAHELNNPLGGILSFLQLIKMDLNKSSPYYTDIEEMEKGVHRCKDIIQNLLSLAHQKPDGPKV